MNSDPRLFEQLISGFDYDQPLYQRELHRCVLVVVFIALIKTMIKKKKAWGRKG